FEELNILTPGLSWSPNGDKIILAAKSGGYDVVYVIDVEDEDAEILPVKMSGIKSVTWSPAGDQIAFIGQTNKESDLFLYNFETREIKNLTNDIFSDDDPAWTPDGKTLYYVSDRNSFIEEVVPDTFKIYTHDY